MNDVIWVLFRAFPTPEIAMKADVKEMSKILRPLGLHNKRAEGIKKFSARFLENDWTDVLSLPGVGK